MTTTQLPIIINTRPIPRAAPLTDFMQQKGYEVVQIPMLTLTPRPVSAHDIEMMRAWLDGHYHALVVVSPTAAASGLAVWHMLENDSSFERHQARARGSMIAVGSATARVLEQAGCSVTQPKIANNEGMLQMPQIKRLQADDRLLIWRGLGGRRLLVDTLQARGVHIDSIAWYERVMPKSAQEQFTQWAQQRMDPAAAPSRPVVIISSGTAFEHWMQVVNEAYQHGMSRYQLSDFCYVALGARLAGMLAGHQLTHWQVEDLAPETIYQAIRDTAPQSLA